jgi:hypothetical protein
MKSAGTTRPLLSNVALVLTLTLGTCASGCGGDDAAGEWPSTPASDAGRTPARDGSAIGTGSGGGGAASPDAAADPGGGDPQGIDGGAGQPATDGGIAPGSDASASCAVGSVGLLGLIPGATMSPGTACVSCHASTGAKKLNVGGTVFTRLNEPDQCIGIASGVQVVITDATGTDHVLQVNATGNFYDTGLFGFTTPYKARVVGAAGSIAMIGAQTNGDCNACHSATGAQAAAGRIVGP